MNVYGGAAPPHSGVQGVEPPARGRGGCPPGAQPTLRPYTLLGG